MREARDPVLDDVGQAALRLMAGTVSRKQLAALRKELLRSPESYPWRETTDAILRVEVDDERLLQQGLRAQRDWVVRGGRETPKPSVKHRSKNFVAYLLSRAIFFVLYTGAVVVLLVLLKAKWPQIDIYAANDWLSGVLPAVFGPR